MVNITIEEYDGMKKRIKELLELIKALEPYVYEEDKYLRLQIEKALKEAEKHES